VFPLLVQAAGINTPVMGAPVLTIVGSNTGLKALTIFSIPVARAVVFSGVLTNVGTGTVTVANPGWAVDEFNAPNQPHYIEITQGSFAGFISDIVDTDGTTGTLTLADDLTSLIAGDESFIIKMHWTISSFFGPNNEAGLQGGTSLSNADEVLLHDRNNQKYSSYFYADYGPEVFQGWVNPGYVDASDVIMPPDSSFIVRREVTSDVTLYVAGPIKTGPAIITVQAGLNLLPNIYPAGFTFDQSSLYTGDNATGVVGGTSLSNANEVLLHDSINQKYFAYFYADFVAYGFQSWVTSGYVDASNTVISAGEGMFLRRDFGDAFYWKIAQPY